MTEPSDHLLRTFGALPIASRVLDLGCGHGIHTEPLARLGFDIYACDPSPEAVENVRSRLDGVLAEGEAEKRIARSQFDALGYPDGYFDWVIAFDSLSRLETKSDLLGTLGEIRRVLRPGGWLYIVVPAVPERESGAGERGYAGDSGLSPTFTPRTLDELVDEAGYAVVESPSVGVSEGARRVQAIYRKIDPAASAHDE